MAGRGPPGSVHTAQYVGVEITNLDQGHCLEVKHRLRRHYDYFKFHLENISFIRADRKHLSWVLKKNIFGQVMI